MSVKGDKVLSFLRNKNERFAYLLNIPCQKYTLGSTYPGPEEKNEFIFCPFPNVDSSHCQIQVDEKGDFWISRASPSAKTFLNHVALREKPVKLQNEDIISLGISVEKRILRTGFFTSEAMFRLTEEEYPRLEYRDPMRGLASLKYYDPVLPLKLSNKKRAEKEIHLGTQIAQNALIMENVLNNFPTFQLINLRYVCRVWNDVISTILGKTVSIKLDFQYDYEGGEGMKLFRYLKEVKSFVPSGLILTMPKMDSYFPFNPAEGEAGQKFSHDLAKFLEVNNNFKHLELNARLETRDELEAMELVLQKLGKNLQSLCITPLTDESSVQQFTDTWELSNVRVFEGSFCDRSSDDAVQNYQKQFARNIVQRLASKLQEFRSFDDNTGYFLQAICEQKFPNLSSVSINLCSRVEISPLLSISSPLRKLDIHEDSLLSDANVSVLNQVLEKHSTSLEHLFFFILSTKKEIEFPKLEKLKMLKLQYGESFSGQREIQYAEVFPALQHLTLRFIAPLPIQYYRGCRCCEEELSKLEYWEEERKKVYSSYDRFVKYPESEVLKLWHGNEKVFNAFIPKGSDQVCSTLVELNVYHIHRKEIPENEEYITRVKEIARLFLNVTEDWIDVSKNAKLKSQQEIGKKKKVGKTGEKAIRRSKRFQ